MLVFAPSITYIDLLCGLVVTILRSRFVSRVCQIFWEVVGLERGPLSLVSAIEELLERKSSGSGLENREYGHRDPSRWPRGIHYPQKLAITSPTSGGRSVGIVRSRTQTMEFSFSFFNNNNNNNFYFILFIWRICYQVTDYVYIFLYSFKAVRDHFVCVRVDL
jgi:hypothetical protein